MFMKILFVLKKESVKFRCAIDIILFSVEWATTICCLDDTAILISQVYEEMTNVKYDLCNPHDVK